MMILIVMVLVVYSKAGENDLKLLLAKAVIMLEGANLVILFL